MVAVATTVVHLGVSPVERVAGPVPVDVELDHGPSPSRADARSPSADTARSDRKGKYCLDRALASTAAPARLVADSAGRGLGCSMPTPRRSPSPPAKGP